MMIICKNCAIRECEGRDGRIVCDIDGEDHEPDYTCENAEQECISIQYGELKPSAH